MIDTIGWIAVFIDFLQNKELSKLGGISCKDKPTTLCLEQCLHMRSRSGRLPKTWGTRWNVKEVGAEQRAMHATGVRRRKKW